MSSDLRFNSVIEVDYHNYGKSPDAELEYDNKIYINWEAELEVRSWGIKDLSFNLVDNKISFKVNVSIPSPEGELDASGDVAYETTEKIITVPRDNIKIEFVKGWHMFPTKLEVGEDNKGIEATLYVSMPCGGADD